MQMNLSSRGGVLWPLALAVIFFSIPVLLALQYPSSFWMGTDNETLGLADALNMAYRLADREMYEAVGMTFPRRMPSRPTTMFDEAAEPPLWPMAPFSEVTRG